jgi:hypothetical protein
MNVALLVSLALLCATALAADFAATEDLAADAPELARMKLAELRYHLRRRGVDECDDCVEKEHFRQRLRAALEEKVEVTRTHEEALAAEKPKKAATPAPNVKTPTPTSMSDDELEGLRETIMKKQKETEQMREAMRKAGLDPNMVKTDTDMFADILSKAGKNKKKAAPPKKPKQTTEEL